MPGLSSSLGTYWPTKRFNKWRCSQHTSTDQTPIPCVPIRLPALKPKGIVVWRADALALTNCASLAWAAKPLNAATPGLGTSVCYLPMKHHLWKWLHYGDCIRLRRWHVCPSRVFGTSVNSASRATFAPEGRHFVIVWWTRTGPRKKFEWTTINI